MVQSQYHGLEGVCGTNAIAPGTIGRLWHSTENSSECLLLRCLESGSQHHLTSSWTVVCSSDATFTWSPICFLTLLQASGTFVPSAFLSKVVPSLRWIVNIWRTATPTRDTYDQAKFVWSKIVHLLCDIHLAHTLPIVSENNVVFDAQNSVVVNALFHSVEHSTAAPIKKRKKKRKHDDAGTALRGTTTVVPAPETVLLHFLMTNKASRKVLLSPTRHQLLEWGTLCAAQLKTAVSKSKRRVGTMELFYREALGAWLSVWKGEQEKEEEEEEEKEKENNAASGLLNGVLVALFKHRVNANDISTDASMDASTDVSMDVSAGVSANISMGKVALLPLHLMAVLVDTLEWDPRLLSGLGGRRHMLTMLLEHSKFDSILESSSSSSANATTTAAIAFSFTHSKLCAYIVRLLLHVRNGMVDETDEKEEQTSMFVLSHVLQHYGATLSKVDRLLRVVIEGERERMRQNRRQNVGKSSMFEVQSSLWGESAKLRKDTLFSQDTSLGKKTWILGAASLGRTIGTGGHSHFSSSFLFFSFLFFSFSLFDSFARTVGRMVLWETRQRRQNDRVWLACTSVESHGGTLPRASVVFV